MGCIYCIFRDVGDATVVPVDVRPVPGIYPLPEEPVSTDDCASGEAVSTEGSVAADESAPSPPEGTVYTTTNELKVDFKVGDFVVIGEDVDMYEYAKVDGVTYNEKVHGHYLSVTYYQPCKDTGRLTVSMTKKGPWTDTCPMDCVIMRLVNTTVDSGLKEKILSITKDIYE